MSEEKYAISGKGILYLKLCEALNPYNPEQAEEVYDINKLTEFVFDNLNNFRIKEN